MKCVIVDDEKNGREVLATLLTDYCAGIEVAGKAAGAEDGYRLINEVKPGLVFLDIEMPGQNGFELLNRLQPFSFTVIFTTAYEQYAIKAIKYRAADYLLKPIDIDELKAACEKALCAGNPGRIAAPPVRPAVINMFAVDKIALPVKNGIQFVAVADIVHIESDGAYSVIHLNDKTKLVVAKNLKEYEDLLPAGRFLRIHKCHLINIACVRKYVRTDGFYAELENGALVEISRRKKDDFFRLMNIRSLQ
jgi:two-component system, LytTR family, response regulator